MDDMGWTILKTILKFILVVLIAAMAVVGLILIIFA
jgi:hypothetical protein